MWPGKITHRILYAYNDSYRATSNSAYTHACSFYSEHINRQHYDGEEPGILMLISAANLYDKTLHIKESVENKCKNCTHGVVKAKIFKPFRDIIYPDLKMFCDKVHKKYHKYRLRALKRYHSHLGFFNCDFSKEDSNFVSLLGFHLLKTELSLRTNLDLILHNAVSHLLHFISFYTDNFIAHNIVRNCKSMFVFPLYFLLKLLISFINTSEDIARYIKLDINLSQLLSLDYFYGIVTNYYFSIHSRKNVNNKKIRKVFRQLPFQLPRHTESNEPHSKSRRYRNHAVKLMKNFSKLLCLKPVWMSPQCSVRGDPVNNYETTVKNVQYDFSYSSTIDKDLLYYVDSDYKNYEHFYIPTTKLLYTFDPSRAADSQPSDCSYTFLDNETVQVISPFNVHVHKMWNYNGNSINVFRWFPWPRFISYKPEKVRFSDTHSFVLLIPEFVLYGHVAVMAADLFKATVPKRVDVGPGRFAKIIVHDDKSHHQHCQKNWFH